MKIENIKNESGWWRYVFFPLLFAYLEMIFHIAIYKGLHNVGYGVLFGALMGAAAAFLTGIFPKAANAVIGYFLMTVFSVYYIVQLIYYRIFGMFLSLVSVKGAENAMDFKAILFQTLRENIGWMLLLILPLAALILLNVFFVSFQRSSLKTNLISGLSLIPIWIAAVLSLGFAGKGAYTPYDLFHNRFVLELSMNKLGVAVTTFRDAGELIFGGQETAEFTLADTIAATASDAAIAVTTASDAKPEYVSQIDESLDFSALYYGTDDEELRNLTGYFSGKTPTMTNEYTGMFEDYNLVFVTAESLSRYGISDTCTPTLNKLMNEGFVYNNFYNPRWYHSTIDGEYVNCLSQYPSSSDWSFYKSAECYEPYALGNALNSLGYKSYAYHDYSFYYYNRSETHANMGYDFKAVDYGLDIPFFGSYSDLDTMETVYEEFINQDKFNMYFMSFSGHLPYTYEYNAVCVRNREEAEKLTEGMDLPEGCVAYIAAQMELDKALEFLIDKLEEAGKLDKTLFVITPDHYPYGLASADYNTLAGSDISDDTFELHRSCLGIWSSSMKEKVQVNKYCSSVDVLPTVLNMMGVNYDSRLLAGHDIMSDSEELVIFSDHSFITDKIKYDAGTGEITYFVDEKLVSDYYVQSTIDKVETELSMSDLMVDKDYFGYAYSNGK